MTLILLGALVACAVNAPLLNSDRIEQTFGNYGVDVLHAGPTRREASLYSVANGVKTTRTYAVVEYQGPPRSIYSREHTAIEAGGSIGATFRQAGWKVDKRHLFIGELEVPATYTAIGELMGIELPQTLATHVYLFIVQKDERSFTYATITEIHHPDYLTEAELKTIYGEIIFDDSNRDRVQDFIGPPNSPK